MADNVTGSDAGAAPTPAATPVAATPATPAAQPATPAAPTAPSPISGQPSDDRTGWVPSYRLREAREAAAREAQTSFSQKEAQLQQQLAQVQQQLHRLVGVGPQENPEVDAVRQQFKQLYPGLADLEERADQIREMIERTGDLESQSQHYWQQYGRQAMDRLFEHAATDLGAPLTDEGRRALHASFTGFVSSSPELTARYAQDPQLVEEFWRAFRSSFIEPARRATAATVATRTGTPLPQDSPSGAVHPSAAPKPANLDERAAQGWALYEQSKKA